MRFLRRLKQMPFKTGALLSLVILIGAIYTRAIYDGYQRSRPPVDPRTLPPGDFRVVSTVSYCIWRYGNTREARRQMVEMIRGFDDVATVRLTGSDGRIGVDFKSGSGFSMVTYGVFDTIAEQAIGASGSSSTSEKSGDRGK